MVFNNMGKHIILVLHRSLLLQVRMLDLRQPFQKFKQKMIIAWTKIVFET